jgi:death-on-curing protein
MISRQAAEQLHEKLIAMYGGSAGTRNVDSLDSALLRPFQTFDGQELYPTILEKAAALIESILGNHPFVDGNKRTGYSLMRLFLLHHQLDIAASQDEKFRFVIEIASGDSRFKDIHAWLKMHVRDVED